jgi:hypothetical protein
MAPCAVPDVTTMMIMSTDSDDSIKHVRFSDEAGVVTREHFSKQENQACWYSVRSPEDESDVFRHAGHRRILDSHLLLLLSLIGQGIY